MNVGSSAQKNNQDNIKINLCFHLRFVVLVGFGFCAGVVGFGFCAGIVVVVVGGVVVGGSGFMDRVTVSLSLEVKDWLSP